MISFEDLNKYLDLIKTHTKGTEINFRIENNSIIFEGESVSGCIDIDLNIFKMEINTKNSFFVYHKGELVIETHNVAEPWNVSLKSIAKRE